MKQCKFCKKSVKRPTQGYCISCYQYFILHKFNTWYPSQYGELARVNDPTSNQYGMPICHICGKAYTKLQQHIWYAHGLTKAEYCNKFGLDKSINMTTTIYNIKMRNYAYKNKMDEQLRRVGKATRFTKGTDRHYVRSYQTQQRLHNMNKPHKNKVG